MPFRIRTLPRRRRAHAAAALAALAGLLIPSLAGAGVVLREVWFPTGEVNFYIADDTEPSRADITYAMDYFSTHTPLDIAEANSSQANLRFESTWVAPNGGGYTYAYWDATRSDAHRKIRFDPNHPPYADDVAHEFGHALGFPHEFQRSDRDSHVIVCNPGAWDSLFNYSMLGAFWPVPYAHLSPYDYASVMNDGYSDCVTPLLGREQQTRTYEDISNLLSRHDINSIYRVYGEPLGNNSQGDRFGAAVASGDYDDDGYEDVAVANIQAGELWLLFYRGVASDDSLLNDLAWMPWFKERLESAVDHNARVRLATGDFNGDGIDDLAMGQPDYDSKRGRVSILFVNSLPSDEGKDGLPEEDFAPWGHKGIQYRIDRGPTEVGLSTEGFAPEFGAALAAVRATNFRNDDSDALYHDLVIGAPRAGQPEVNPLAARRQPAVSEDNLAAKGAIVILKGRVDPSPGTFSTDERRVIFNPITDQGLGEFGAAVAAVPGLCTAAVPSAKYYRDGIAVGAPGNNVARGAVHIYGCATAGVYGDLETPSLQSSLWGYISYGRFGEALAGFRVFDGASRTSHLVVGQPGFPWGGDPGVGRVVLYEFRSSPTPALISLVVPTVHDGEDGFGGALAVQQHAFPEAPFDEGGDLVYIGIGTPRAFVDGVRAGEVHVWRPFQSPTTTTVIPAANPDGWEGARFGAHIATLRPLSTAGGFVAAAPDGIVDGVVAGQVSTLQNFAANGTWATLRHNLDQETEGDLRPTNR
jgi:hypothetical protein